MSVLGVGDIYNADGSLRYLGFNNPFTAPSLEEINAKRASRGESTFSPEAYDAYLQARFDDAARTVQGNVTSGLGTGLGTGAPYGTTTSQPTSTGGGKIDSPFSNLLDTVQDVQDGTVQAGDIKDTPTWNAGSQSGGMSTDGGGPVEWNWGDLQTGAPSLDGGGGYDPNDYAFDRYVAGQESPWGIPDIEGGNKDFYRNQFVNLLRQEQNFQNKQREAAQIRQDALDNPVEGMPMDWSWIEGGLPEVKVGGQENWQLNPEFSGMTNSQILEQLRGEISPQTYQFFQNQWAENPTAADSRWWQQKSNPAEWLSAFDQNDPWANSQRQALSQSSMFQNTGAPAGIPTGYASPSAGFQGSANSGYQQGGAAYVFNPASGQWDYNPINNSSGVINTSRAQTAVGG